MATRLKLRLLLVWGYHRAGWIAPFEQLRDQFDIHYLFFRSALEEEGSLTDAPRYYWSDFRDASSVVDRVAPDRIVFMALDGAWVIALNSEARRRRIATFVVQHGFVGPGARSSHGHVARPLGEALGSGSPTQAVLFGWRSFGATRLVRFLRVLWFMSDVRRMNPRTAMRRHRFADRCPDYYVALSPESAQFYLQIDRATPDRIACIGVPEYDDVFRSVPTTVPEQGPVLLVDSPNAENRWNATSVTISEKVRFLQLLDETSSQMGRRLRVKLHPETYRAEWLPDLVNGTYVRDTNLGEEYSKAAICVGFDSTLMVPAIWLRPTVLVRLRPSRIIDSAAETGAACVVTALDEVDAALLRSALDHFHHAESERGAYVRRFAYRTDGRAVQRLGQLFCAPEQTMRRYSLSASDEQERT